MAESQTGSDEFKAVGVWSREERFFANRLPSVLLPLGNAAAGGKKTSQGCWAAHTNLPLSACLAQSEPLWRHSVSSHRAVGGSHCYRAESRAKSLARHVGNCLCAYDVVNLETWLHFSLRLVTFFYTISIWGIIYPVVSWVARTPRLVRTQFDQNQNYRCETSLRTTVRTKKLGLGPMETDRIEPSRKAFFRLLNQLQEILYLHYLKNQCWLSRYFRRGWERNGRATPSEDKEPVHSFSSIHSNNDRGLPTS